MSDLTANANVSAQFVNAPAPSTAPESQLPLAQQLAQAQPVAQEVAVAMNGGAPDAAIPSAPPLRTFRTAVEYQNWAADTRTDTANAYAQMGRGGEIGSDQFNADLRSNMIATGLMSAPPPVPEASWWQGMRGTMGNNFRESLGDSNMGWAAMTVAGAGMESISQGYIRQQGLLGGQYVAPEQFVATSTEATNSGLMTGGGALLGGLIGMFAGNPLVGAGIGAAAGGGISSMLNATLDASTQRNITARETSEGVVPQLGGAVSALQQFEQALKEAGAPLEQLRQGLGIITSLGPGYNNTTTISGSATMANALGDRYDLDMKNMSAIFTANPSLNGLRSEFNSTGSQLPSSDYEGVALLSAYEGNFDGAKSALEMGQKVQQNPRWTRLNAFVTSYQKEGKLKHFWEHLTDTSPDDSTLEDYYNKDVNTLKTLPQYTTAQSANNAQMANSVTAAEKAYLGYETLMDGSGRDFDLSQINITSDRLAGLSDSALRRDTSAQIGSEDKLMNGTLSVANQIRRQVKLHPSKDAATNYANLQRANDIEKQSGQYQMDALTNQRAAEGEFMSTMSNMYDFTYNQGSNEGMSTADQLPLIHQRVSQLIDNSKRYHLTDSERLAMQNQAQELGYQTSVSMRAQALEGNDVSIAGGILGVANSSLTGTPGQLRSSQQQYAGDLTAKENTLKSQISDTNLGYDERLQKLQQIKEIQAQIVQTEVNSKLEYYSNIDSIIGNDVDAIQVGMSLQAQTGGSGSVNLGGYDSGIDSRIDNLQAALKNAPNSRIAAQYKAQIAQLTNQRSMQINATDDFVQGGADQQQSMNVGAALQIAMLNPYQGGPNSNPWQVGNQELSVIHKRMSQRNAYRASLLGQVGPNGEPLWSTVAQTEYTQANDADLVQQAQVYHDERFAMFGAVPEMLAGAPQGGLRVGALPFAALAAHFSGSPLVGSFGKGYGPNLMGGPPGQEGGAAGAMVTAASSPDTMYLKKIADAVTSINVKTIPRASSPRQNSAGGVNRGLSMSFDPAAPTGY